MRMLIAVVIFVVAALPAAADDACKQKVDDAFTKLRANKSFRLETTIVNAQGKLNMKADYVLPDRMHQVVRLGDEGAAMEMIVVGKRAWSNQGQGWAELPEKFAETVAKQMQETVAAPTKTMTDYKCLGEQDLEGKTYSVFQGVLPMPIDPAAEQKGPRLSALSTPNQQKVYVDKVTGLPVRNIVNPVTEPEKRLFDGRFTIVEGLNISEPETKAN